jgi:hypothetical protein
MDELPPPIIEQPITSVDQSTLKYFRAHIGRVVGFLIVFAVIEIGAVTGFILNGAASNSAGNNGNTIYGIFIIFPLVALVVAYSYVRQRILDEFFEQFAKANGYAFSEHGENFSALDGALFRLGYDQTVADTVSGTYLGCPICLFLYSYVTGSGKQRRIHRYTVFELQFDTVMPDLLLEKKESLFDIGFGAGLFGQLPEHIKLEGDFNKYFSLSIKKGYEVEALEVFTPDVMEELEEKCKNLSLEIVNSHLFIYDNGTISTKVALDALYDVAQYFVQKLAPVLARMKAPTEAMEEVQG